MVGDSLYYDSKSGVGEGFRNVVYTDEVNKNMLTGNYCYYNDSTGYSMATDSAVAIDYSQRDTMYMHADTFKVYTFYMDTDSMYREVRAITRCVPTVWMSNRFATLWCSIRVILASRCTVTLSYGTAGSKYWER